MQGNHEAPGDSRRRNEWVLSWRFLYHPGLLRVLFQSAPVICSLDYCSLSFNKERKEERAPCIVLEHKLSNIHLRFRLSTVALALCALCFLSLLRETHPVGKVGDGCLRPWQLLHLSDLFQKHRGFYNIRTGIAIRQK